MGEKMTTTTAAPATADEVDATARECDRAIERAGRALMLDLATTPDDLSYAVKCGREALAAQATYRERYESWWHETLTEDERRASGVGHRHCYRARTPEGSAR